MKTEQPKPETLEEAARKYASYNFDSSFLDIDDHFEAGAKWQQEQDKKMYSEEDMIAFGKSCFYKGFDKAENDDANCYTAFREEIGKLFEQLKK